MNNVIRREFTETTTLSTRIKSYVAQYNETIQTPVQEYLSNARDAWREYKNKNPKAGMPSPLIEVFFEKEDNQEYFCIRDYSGGMDQSNLERFTNFGDSLKTEDKETLGEFGLGCKASLCYNDHFDFTNFYNGEAQSFKAHVEGYIDEYPKVKTDKKNGLLIRIPIKKDSDKVKFLKATVRASFLWEESERPFIRPQSEDELKRNWWNEYNMVYEGNSFKVFQSSNLKSTSSYSDSGFYVNLNGILYSIDNRFTSEYSSMSELKDLLKVDYTIVIDASDLETKRDREFLLENEENIQKVHNYLSVLKSELIDINNDLYPRIMKKDSLLNQHNVYKNFYEKDFRFLAYKKVELYKWDFNDRKTVVFKNDVEFTPIRLNVNLRANRKREYKILNKRSSVNIEILKKNNKVFLNSKRQYKDNTIKSKIKSMTETATESTIYYFLNTGETEIFKEFQICDFNNISTPKSKKQVDRKDKYNVEIVSGINYNRFETKSKTWNTLEEIKLLAQESSNFFSTKEYILISKKKIKETIEQIEKTGRSKFIFDNFNVLLVSEKNYHILKKELDVVELSEIKDVENLFDYSAQVEAYMRVLWWNKLIDYDTRAFLKKLTTHKDLIQVHVLKRLIDFNDEMTLLSRQVDDSGVNLPHFAKEHFMGVYEESEKESIADFKLKKEQWEKLFSQIFFFKHCNYSNLASRHPEEVIEYINFSINYKSFKQYKFLKTCEMEEIE